MYVQLAAHFDDIYVLYQHYFSLSIIQFIARGCLLHKQG
jgi:hypothetical protein